MVGPEVLIYQQPENHYGRSWSTHVPTNQKTIMVGPEALLYQQTREPLW